MLALLAGAWRLLSGLPWWAYAAAGLVAFHFVDRVHYASTRVDEARVEWQREAARAQQRADALANAEISGLRHRLDKNLEYTEWRLQEEKKASVAALEDLKGRFPAYVTPTQLSRCADIPRGFLLFGADAAAFANGGDPHAPPPAVGTLDAPSGVSVAAYADTVSDQAAAYRTCAKRVDAWRGYVDSLTDYYESVITALHANAAPQPHEGTP